LVAVYLWSLPRTLSRYLPSWRGASLARGYESDVCQRTTSHIPAKLG
jgi:hypothetical protein